MKPRGNNPLQNIIAVIPARFASERLPGKMLLPLAGKPLILHTATRARAAEKVSRVIVATDHQEIYKTVIDAGFEAKMTSPEHQTGSDRLAEVARQLPADSIIVNVQGDEPLISPETIDRAIDALLETPEAQMATTCEPITDTADVLSPDVVKVVRDSRDLALYFSRSPIPYPREAARKFGLLEAALQSDSQTLNSFFKHTGLYVYRRDFLLEYTKLPQTTLEKTEMLEQLRALENGFKIKVVEVSKSSIGVDTKADFERVKAIIESQQSIIYREAEARDIPQIARVHVESWQKSFAGIVPQSYLDKMSVEKRTERWSEIFERNLDRQSFYKLFVAETGEDGIVGFADCGESSECKNGFDAELYAIYFLPQFQRKGIGGNLFRLCQKEILAQGLKSMSLEALAISPYRAFYEKMGGRIVGEGKYDIGGVEFKTLIYGWDDLSKYE